MSTITEEKPATLTFVEKQVHQIRGRMARLEEHSAEFVQLSQMTSCGEPKTKAIERFYASAKNRMEWLKERADEYAELSAMVTALEGPPPPTARNLPTIGRPALQEDTQTGKMLEFMQPNYAYYSKQVAEGIGASSVYVHSALNNFVAKGLVTRKNVRGRVMFTKVIQESNN